MDDVDSVLLIAGGALCVGVLALVLFNGSPQPQALTCARVRVPGGSEPGLRARYATGALRGLGVLPLVFLGAVGVGLGAGVGDLGWRPRVAGWVLVLATVALGAYRSRGGAARFHYLALTPSGVVLRPARYWAFVAWNGVADVVLVGRNVDTAQLGLVLARPDAVRAGGLDRLSTRTGRPRRVDLAVHLSDLDADPRAVVHAFCYYLDRPERRDDLGTRQELEHLLAVQRRELDRR